MKKRWQQTYYLLLFQMQSDVNRIYEKGYRINLLNLTASQRLANQARMILKKDWFSDLQILKIFWQVNREEFT